MTASSVRESPLHTSLAGAEIAALTHWASAPTPCIRDIEDRRLEALFAGARLRTAHAAYRRLKG